MNSAAANVAGPRYRCHDGLQPGETLAAKYRSDAVPLHVQLLHVIRDCPLDSLDISNCNPKFPELTQQ